MTLNAKFLMTATVTAIIAGLGAPSQSSAGPLVNFENLITGNSVEGAGTVHPDLQINGIQGTAQVIETANATLVTYGGPQVSGPSQVNNCLEDAGGLRVNVDPNAASSAKGFADKTAQTNQTPMNFDFTFLNGATVNSFSVVMFDFGDFSPDTTTNHMVELIAKDASNAPVNTFTLNYNSETGSNPNISDYGDLLSTGDACDDSDDGLGDKQDPQNSSTAVDGPGYLKMNVIGSGIAKVELRIQNAGLDPNIGFDSIGFTREADINVHPASDPNPLNLKSGGSTPVAIFGSASFNVADIDVSSLTLNDAMVKAVGKSGKTLCSIEDIGSVDTGFFDDLGDPDSFDDLVCHFVTSDIVGLMEGEGLDITVSGNLNDGTPFSGSDVVKVVKD